jgi:DNA-binding NarL/FixJ family response regulator
VVLTSSEQVRDVNLAYRLGANSFLVKAVDFKDLVELTQAIHGYWLWLSKAPEAFRQEPENDGQQGGQAKRKLE